ncbi:Transcriptional regulator, MerR family [Bifidobacterium leontopitheci]|uniref:Transcriptional regulator, MerR family n=1 Tax=Bifidobacterium leontopitheci TaxID=2650774 RepID=A0A6I1GS43_9BIFI|nr:Transcriptional regulator, MerR family [Bifidobacterium leontopitheci]
MAAMPLSGSLGAIRTALTGDPRFADPCGESLYGSKACADFANAAMRIHAQHIAARIVNDA